MKRWVIVLAYGVGLIVLLTLLYLSWSTTGWFLAIIIPAYVVLAFVEDARQRRRHVEFKGYCLQCGYDLRASKVRCPECGTPIPAEADEVRGR
ncbi:MAG: hypothetical protein ACM359_09305 [Bacillota bacterium]